MGQGEVRQVMKAKRAVGEDQCGMFWVPGGPLNSAVENEEDSSHSRAGRAG